MRKEDRRGLEIRLSVLESLKPESEDDQRSIGRNVRHVKRMLSEDYFVALSAELGYGMGGMQ